MTDPDAPPPGNPPMRASDADRAATAERLRVGLTEGRLTVSEYDERVRAAYAAVTQSELEPLVADLPEPVPDESPEEVARREEERRRLVRQWRDWAGTSFMLLGIWAVISLVTGSLIIWPIFPVGIWAIVLLSGMLFGSDEPGCCDPERRDGGSHGPVVH